MEAEDNTLYQQKLKQSNIHKKLILVVDNYLADFEVNIHNKYELLYKNLSRDREKAKLVRDAKKYIDIVQKIIANVKKKFLKKQIHLNPRYDEILLNLKKTCEKIDQLDEQELEKREQAILNEIFLIKKEVFCDCSLINVEIANKNNNHRLYLGTVVQMDIYLDEYELDTLRYLITEGWYLDLFNH